MANFDIKDIKGVIPALITCFDENENFDEKRMRKVVRHLLDKKVDGLYLTGSTGETFLMTGEERKRVVEVVVDEVKGSVPIIVHVGDIGTKKSIELAKHAYEAGADALSSVPPFYWRFNEESILNYYKDITESTPLPMIVYNVPLAGLMGFEMIEKLAKIDGVKGIKYTATTHFDILRIKEQVGEDFIVYSGCDEMSMSGLAFGADGIIGSFYNIMPEVFIKLYDAVKNNDLVLAKRTQEIANAIIMFSIKYNYLGLMKRVLAWEGIDAGYCRKPFTNFTKAEEEDLKKAFVKIREKHNITDVDFLNAL